MLSAKRVWAWWNCGDYEAEKVKNSYRIVKKQTRGSVSGQNGWFMSDEELKKQSRSSDKNMQSLRESVESLSC